MPMLAPLTALSRRVHAAPRRRGLGGALQRVAILVLPAPRFPLPLLDAGPPGTFAARDRARRALMEARREMTGLIGDRQTLSGGTAIVPTVLPDLERLQGFLEESERDRATLRTEVGGLRELLEQMNTQLGVLQQMVEALPRPTEPASEEPGEQAESTEPPAEAVTEVPTPSAESSPPMEALTPRATDHATAASDGDGTEADPGLFTDSLRRGGFETCPYFSRHPDVMTAEAVTIGGSSLPGGAPVEHSGETGAAAIAPAERDAAIQAAAVEPDITELRERVLRALRERVFAAGTVGTRIEIRPSLTGAEAASVLTRMNEEALVELAEEGPPAEEATSVRVTLRAPLRWEQFSSLLEAALGQPLPPGSVGWSQGVVRVNTTVASADLPGQTSE